MASDQLLLDLELDNFEDILLIQVLENLPGKLMTLYNSQSICQKFMAMKYLTCSNQTHRHSPLEFLDTTLYSKFSFGQVKF